MSNVAMSGQDTGDIQAGSECDWHIKTCTSVLQYPEDNSSKHFMHISESILIRMVHLELPHN